MTSLQRALVTGLSCIVLASGCGDSGGGKTPKLATVTGVVTYKNAPLAGANVTFMPENGPLAMAVTDLNGEFKLNSGAIAGCAIGKAKASVSVSSPDDKGSASAAPGAGSSPDEVSKQLAQATLNYQKTASAKPKSLIPDRYKDPSTSHLEYVVDADASKNKFEIKLTD